MTMTPLMGLFRPSFNLTSRPLSTPQILGQQTPPSRDFTYPTTQPSYNVGPHNQTLADYRLANLHALPHNRSTSVWFPDSRNGSNGTVVKNAHVTILGAQNGTQTRLGQPNNSSRNLFLLPTNGTILAQLDYSTAIPHRTCTVTNGTKNVCHQHRHESVRYPIASDSVAKMVAKRGTGDDKRLAYVQVLERPSDGANDDGPSSDDHDTSHPTKNDVCPDKHRVATDEYNFEHDTTSRIQFVILHRS